jgi:hypothetical protein
LSYVSDLRFYPRALWGAGGAILQGTTSVGRQNYAKGARSVFVADGPPSSLGFDDLKRLFFYAPLWNFSVAVSYCYYFYMVASNASAASFLFLSLFSKYFFPWWTEWRLLVVYPSLYVCFVAHHPSSHFASNVVGWFTGSFVVYGTCTHFLSFSRLSARNIGYGHKNLFM